MRANYKVCIIVIIIWNYNFTCVNEFQMYSISFIRENEVLIRFNPLTFLFHIIDFNLKRINLYPHKEWSFIIIFFLIMPLLHYIFKKLSFDMIMPCELKEL